MIEAAAGTFFAADSDMADLIDLRACQDLELRCSTKLCLE